MESRILKVGIFVDGRFFETVARHYLVEAPPRAPLSLEGLAAWCRNEAARRTGTELGLCRVVDATYFRTSSQAAGESVENGGPIVAADAVLCHGFSVFAVPADSGAAAADVCLATEALDRVVRHGLDVVVLVAGTPALASLLRKLAAFGATTMVVGFDVTAPDRRGAARRYRTSPALLEEAAWPVAMSQMIVGNRAADPVLRRLFPGRVQEPAPAPEAPVTAVKVEDVPVSPEPAAAATSAAPAAEPQAPQAQPRQPEPARQPEPPPGPLSGRIADIRDRMGFLVEEWNGRRLVVHNSAVVGGLFSDLRPGDRVEYTRGLDPRNRPAALQVQRIPAVPPAAAPSPQPVEAVPEPAAEEQQESVSGQPSAESTLPEGSTDPAA